MLGGLAGARRRLPLSDHAQQDDTGDIGSQLGGASLSLFVQIGWVSAAEDP